MSFYPFFLVNYRLRPEIYKNPNGAFVFCILLIKEFQKMIGKSLS